MKSNGSLSAGISPTDSTFSLGDVLTFETTGRAFVGDELVSWDGSTITGTPAGDLLNVVRGIGGTTADSHTTASSVYNAWIEERIENVTARVNDALPNYDPFPDARSLSDPTPASIEMITKDIVAHEAFRKMGIDRSDNDIHQKLKQDAEAKLTALTTDSIAIEPRFFVDTLTFGQEDVLLGTEAPLAKRNIDPWTASMTGVQVKFLKLNPDEMVNESLPRRARSEEFVTAIGAFVYFSELQNRWVLRAVGSEITDNTNISYQFTENRMNVLSKRKAQQRGWVDVARG